MLKDPRVNQAFQMYEEKLDQHYPVSIWSQLHLSKESEEKLFQAVKKKTHRLKWKRAFVRVGEGLAVAAVFCIMAYAVYLAAQGHKDPIVAATGETETKTQTETVTSETTKTEREINPLYVRALENQASAIDRVLAEQKASGEDLYQEFVLTLIKCSTPNAQTVWSESNKMQAISNNILVAPYYSPTVLEIVLPELEKAYFSDNLDWAEELISALMFKRGLFPGLSQMKISGWNSNTQKEETFTVVEVRDILDKRKAELKLQAEINKINEEFQRAANMLVKEKYPSSGYREYLRLSKSDYRQRIDPYIVDGITVTMDNFEDLFLEKNLEYQKDPDFWKKLRTGDLVFLGRYEQDNNLENGAEPILWEVMDWSPDGKLYLQSCAVMRYMIWTEGDYKADPTQLYWENSPIRTWLNGEFYEGAFSAEEKALIQTATLDNDWYDGYDGGFGGLGGNDTEDRVFVYSMREVFGNALYHHHYAVSHKISNEYAVATAPPVEEYQISDRNQTWYRQFGVQKMYDGYFNFPRAVRAAVLIQIPNA